MDDQGFTGLTVSWHDGLARWELVCYTSHEREGGRGSVLHTADRR